MLVNVRAASAIRASEARVITVIYTVRHVLCVCFFIQLQIYDFYGNFRFLQMNIQQICG